MPERLTDKSVWECAAPEKGNAIYWDAANVRGKDWTPGFGVRVTAAGARAFIFNYRTKAGLARRLTIGTLPTWTLSAAREEARRLKLLVDNGGDPLGEVQTARGAPTVNELCERFIAEHLPKKRPTTSQEYTAQINAYIRPALGTRKVAEVTFADVDKLHQALTRAGKLYRANRVVATLSKMFTLAIRWGWRADNPTTSVERNQEHKRARYLSANELVRLFDALSKHADQQAANIIRLLVLTGARRGEWLAAKWENLNLEAGVWTKPAATTKQKREHRVSLNGPARQILDAVREQVGEGEQWVFPGRIAGQHRSNIKDSWRDLCKVAEIKGARIHDLRHTYASLLASDGQSLLVIGALLGHTQAATTHRYAHLLDDPLKQATERVGALLQPALTGKVVALKGGRHG